MPMLLPYQIQDQHFTLSTHRCLFWEEQKLLLVADLHLGKTGHFRKAGIAVPQPIYRDDLHRLFSAIQYFKPEGLIILGDMFHSKINKEFEFFLKWRKDLQQLPIQLIKGNHDIVLDDWYTTANLTIHPVELEIANMGMVHDFADIKHPHSTTYYLSGHVHPAIAVKGIGKQHLQFPCFYFGKQHGLLPAFSMFSGYYCLKPKKSDTVIAIVQEGMQTSQQDTLIQLSPA